MSLAAKIIRKPIEAYQFVRLYSQHLPQAFDAIFSMQCAVTLLRGALKGSDEEISVLYVGRRVNYPYLCRMMFEEHRAVENEISNLFAFRKHMDRMSDAADVVVLDLGWPYNRRFISRGGYLEVPDWINLAVEFPDAWEDVVGNFRRTARKHDLRLIRRNGYRCEPVNSRKAIETFYNEMYVPFVKHRHSAESVIAPRRLVIKRALQGQLLQIFRGDDIVAAGIIYPEREIMFSLWLGIPRKYLNDQPEAAISALYFFGIQYAFDNGYEVFDFTGTRAFLGDGAYQFKRRWGPVIEDSFSPGSILIQPKRGNRKAALFCQQVPVLTRTEEGLEAVFVSVDGPVDEVTFARLEKDYWCAGIARMIVIEISDKNETRSMPIGEEGCQYRHIKIPLDTFADLYVNIG